MAVGHDNGGGFGKFTELAERWNGSTWTIVPTPNPPCTSVTCKSQGGDILYGVSCPSPTNCVGVGTMGIERWDGTRWTVQPSPNPNEPNSQDTLYGVSCSSSTACTAVGSFDQSGAGAAFTLAERWNGVKWTIQPTPNTSNSLGPPILFFSVSCPTATDCMAVGYEINEGTLNSENLTERWDGSKWSVVPDSSNANQGLAEVSCASPTDCISTGGTAVVEHWDGNKLTDQATPAPTGASQHEFGGANCGTGGCTIVGSSTISTPTKYAQYTLVEHHS
jgi:hypothetical protein